MGHFDYNHKDCIKPLFGCPILFNLFSLQHHFISNMAKIMMDNQIFFIKSAMPTDFFQHSNIKNFFNLIVRRQFVEYNALDSESMLVLNKAECQNIVCLKFEPEHIHLFKKSFTSSIAYCRKHISAPPTSMGWKKSDDYTEKKLVRLFRKKKTKKLKEKPKLVVDS